MADAIIVGHGSAAALDDITATAADIVAPKVSVNQNGDPITGTIPNRGNLSITDMKAGTRIEVQAGYYTGGSVAAASLASQTEATATANQILSGRTAYVNGQKITGTIASMAGQTVTPSASSQTVSTNGKYLTGNIIVNPVANLSASNIKAGVTVGGVRGTFTSDANAVAADMRNGRTAYVNGKKITGTARDFNGTVLGPGILSEWDESQGRYYIYPDDGFYTGTALYVSGTSIANNIGATANKILVGQTIAGIYGTATSDATAAPDQILSNKTAYVNGKKITGTMLDKAKSANAVGGTQVLVDSETNIRPVVFDDDSRYQTYNIPKGFYNGQVRLGVRSSSFTVTPSRVEYTNPISSSHVIESFKVKAVSPKYLLHGYFKSGYDYIVAPNTAGYTDAIEVNLYKLINTVDGEKVTVKLPDRYKHFWNRISDPEDSIKTITNGYGFTVEVYNQFSSTSNIVDLYHIFVSTCNTYGTSSFIMRGGANGDADGTKGIWKCTFEYINGPVLTVKCIRRSPVEPEKLTVTPVIRVIDQLVYSPSSFVKSSGLSTISWGRLR